MWLLLFVALFSTSSKLNQEANTNQRPRLIVQVVDPVWLPISGAEVKVRPAGRTSETNSIRTDENGYAKFFVPDDADYSIESIVAGFKKAGVKRVHIFKTGSSPSTAYVQLQLELGGVSTTVY